MKIITALIFGALVLAGCNTVNGMGDDLKGASHAISRLF